MEPSELSKFNNDIIYRLGRFLNPQQKRYLSLVMPQYSPLLLPATSSQASTSEIARALVQISEEPDEWRKQPTMLKVVILSPKLIYQIYDNLRVLVKETSSKRHRRFQSAMQVLLTSVETLIISNLQGDPEIEENVLEIWKAVFASDGQTNRTGKDVEDQATSPMMLKNLKRLSLSRVSTEFVSLVLARIDPESLTHLKINHIDNLDNGTNPETLKLLRNFVNLRHIDVSHNELGLGRCSKRTLLYLLQKKPNLETLRLRSTKLGSITALGANHLFRALRTTTTLKHVDLMDNDMGALGSGHILLGHILHDKPNMKILDLTSCHLEKMPVEEVLSVFGECHMDGLEVLEASHNDFGMTEAGRQILTLLLRNKPRLQRLNLCFNNLCRITANDVAAMEAEFKSTGMPELVELDLASNFLGSTEGGRELLRFLLSSKPRMRILKLDWSSLWQPSVEEAEELFQSFVAMEQIEEIQVSHNDLGSTEGGIKALQYLAHHKPHLRRLMLDNNNLGKASLEAAGPVVRSLGEMAKIEELDLSFNALGTSACGKEILKQALHQKPWLRWLGLSDNALAQLRLAQEDEAQLSTEIAELRGLEKVILGSNLLGSTDDGRKLLLYFLQRNSLRSLDLSENALGSLTPEETEEYLSRLGHMDRLRGLNLSNNALGTSPNGSDILRFGLCNKPEIETLQLQMNRLSQLSLDWAEQLFEPLGEMKRLEIAAFSHNQLGETKSGRRILEKLLHHKPLMTYLLLANNALAAAPSEVFREIEDMKSLKILNVTENDLAGTRVGRVLEKLVDARRTKLCLQ
ncbi:uncharacterized protein BJ171DRAFT_512560 [Polychytrium aggregatum]|uniref:uncharacterized protein n=1 Tax=Polychytrium aggregatum TaxID=110093 RepID=UPI0022FEDBC0|nr:uncharacterized protein BJ171DRAFT_512560 [Polychytrium aggregatum]KAI9202900.1 hypothetical protein BJ171DRAFT_512560 [Polychytrium aggregatum]